MKCRTLTVLAAVNVVYIVLGGVAFHFLETTNEEDTRDYTRGILAHFLKNHSCVTTDEMDALLNLVTSAYDKGVLVTLTNTSQPSNWDLASSISFSTTVITTIGYGYLSPSTSGGRGFCVFYAVVGIPLCLTMLGVLGSKLSLLTERLSARIQGRLQRRTNVSSDTFCGRWFGWIFVVVSGLLVFVLVPSAVLSHVEDWSYGESLYFSAITLTTIGFGDYVMAGDYDGSSRTAYRILSTVWIILGLAWCATCIASTQDKFTAIVMKHPPGGDEEEMITPQEENKIKEETEASEQKASPEHDSPKDLPTLRSHSGDGCNGTLHAGDVASDVHVATESRVERL